MNLPNPSLNVTASRAAYAPDTEDIQPEVQVRIDLFVALHTLFFTDASKCPKCNRPWWAHRLLPCGYYPANSIKPRIIVVRGAKDYGRAKCWCGKTFKRQSANHAFCTGACRRRHDRVEKA
jgi:hypothetical protein